MDQSYGETKGQHWIKVWIRALDQEFGQDEAAANEHTHFEDFANGARQCEHRNIQGV